MPDEPSLDPQGTSLSAKSKDAPSDPKRSDPSIADFMWIGTGCALCILIPGALGYWLDDLIGTLPWFTLGGLVFGMVSAVLMTITTMRRYF